MTTPDIDIRIDGRTGHITLTREKALNALTYDMCLAIEAALDSWREDSRVAMVLIDAAGSRAFCAGGDIAEMYESGMRQDFDYGRRFWRDEYRMNAKLFNFPKPVVSLMQGFTMGGGVGVGCHGSHRVVGESSQIAMPEVSIGLIPDVGGSLILSRAPGRLGEYLGLTAARMGPGDAIYAGFADYFVPETNWPELTAELIETGDWTRVDAFARPAPGAILPALQPEIDAHFAGETLGDISRSLRFSDSEFAKETLDKLSRNSPLSMAATVEILHRVRGTDEIARALEQEYRFTHRAMEHADFLEGIRAQIIDKDRNPHWKHKGCEAVPAPDVANILLPLKSAALDLKETRP